MRIKNLCRKIWERIINAEIDELFCVEKIENRSNLHEERLEMINMQKKT